MEIIKGRRDFMIKGGLISISALLAACAPKTSKAISETHEPTVVPTPDLTQNLQEFIFTPFWENLKELSLQNNVNWDGNFKIVINNEEVKGVEPQSITFDKAEHIKVSINPSDKKGMIDIYGGTLVAAMRYSKVHHGLSPVLNEPKDTALMTLLMGYSFVFGYLKTQNLKNGQPSEAKVSSSSLNYINSGETFSIPVVGVQSTERIPPTVIPTNPGASKILNIIADKFYRQTKQF